MAEIGTDSFIPVTGRLHRSRRAAPPGHSVEVTPPPGNERQGDRAGG